MNAVVNSAPLYFCFVGVEGDKGITVVAIGRFFVRFKPSFGGLTSVTILERNFASSSVLAIRPQGETRIPLPQAIYFNLLSIINLAPVPDENDGPEGRYNFTLAHEVGHWVLRRFEFLAPDVLKQQGDNRGILCRAIQRKEPRERQADQFASHLLMPRPVVQKVWRERHGNLVMDVGSVDSFKQGGDLKTAMKDYYLLVKDFVQIFAVAGQAMRIRLTELGLSVRKTNNEAEAFFCPFCSAFSYFI
ncbi:MAG: ImmA/IrrE family metallo-endopeptidase [Desulfovibrio sp.]|jgi:hypothetical protein|nr:ImmA/IrrE family metallo-endopeptidase [Desulfovibrio sp.]